MSTTNATAQSTRRLIWQFTKYVLKYIAASAATLILTFLAAYAVASVAALISGETFLNANTVAGVAFGAFLMSLYWVPALPLLLVFAFPLWVLVDIGARAVGMLHHRATITACVVSWLGALTMFVSVAEGYAISPWSSTHAAVLALVAVLGLVISSWIFRPIPTPAS